MRTFDTTLGGTARLATLLVALLGAGPAGAGSLLEVEGKGIEVDGNTFRFVFAEPSKKAGRVEFETTSFGTIDCFSIDGALMLMSGLIDEPTGGVTHFLVIAEDGAGVGSPDAIVTYLRGDDFDCGIGGLDAGLAANREPIQRGKDRAEDPPNV